MVRAPIFSVLIHNNLLKWEQRNKKGHKQVILNKNKNVIKLEKSPKLRVCTDQILGLLECASMWNVESCWASTPYSYLN